MAEKRKASRCTIDATQGRGADVIVIGAGLAGLLAAAYAVRAGARVRLIATGWGQQIVSPGWISVCDRADDDVIAEVRGHAALCPDHPYALAGPDALVCALDLFQDMAEAAGEPFVMRLKDGHNLRLATMLGAIQTPLLAPQGMAAGDLTDVEGPLLIAGFDGWRDFYPALVAGNLSAQGIAARPLTVTLPAERGSWDDWPANLARRFDSSDFRAAVLRQIQPQVKDAVRVGFPAVLGMEQHAEVLREFEAGLGCPVFEIPTLPPSPAGARLSNGIRRWLLHHGARVQIGHAVVRGIVEQGAVAPAAPSGEQDVAGVFLSSDLPAESVATGADIGSRRVQALAQGWPSPLIGGYVTLPAEARDVAANVLCGRCVRRPVWRDIEPAGDEIPCPEPCSVMVSLCRDAAVWESNRPPSTPVDSDLPWAAFDMPGNVIREHYLGERFDGDNPVGLSDG